MTSLQFHSERFDHSSDLPAHYNAGNRFYGADVAQFIAAGLNAGGHEAAALDEDWGWLVSCRFDATSILEVAIYNLSEHREGGRPGAPQWGLWLRAHRKKKILGFLPRSVEVDVTAAQAAVLRDIFAATGIVLEPWSDGPDDDGEP